MWTWCRRRRWAESSSFTVHVLAEDCRTVQHSHKTASAGSSHENYPLFRWYALPTDRNPSRLSIIPSRTRVWLGVEGRGSVGGGSGSGKPRTRRERHEYPLSTAAS